MPFLEGFSKTTGTERFVNSGVGLSRELDRTKLDFDSVGDGFQDFISNGVVNLSQRQPFEIIAKQRDHVLAAAGRKCLNHIA